MKALGGVSQKGFQTSKGMRYVDQLVNGIAHESKVGRASLTKDISKQIAKDAELLKSGQVQGVTWHFFKSPKTGLGGPTTPLQNELVKNGFNVVLH